VPRKPYMLLLSRLHMSVSILDFVAGITAWRQIAELQWLPFYHFLVTADGFRSVTTRSHQDDVQMKH